jgi:ABC-type amino acid transport system permease subunit
MNRPPLQAAIVGLGMNGAAYLSEVYRAGIQSIHRGQLEAALSLGMTPRRALQHIVLPQAIRTMLPPITNFAIVLLKDTSIVFVVGVVEVMALARNLVTETLQSAVIYLMAGALYLCVTIPMARLAMRLERQRQAWH